MFKVMVTGGAGFVGSHVVDELIYKGIEVVVIDNLITGKEENINRNATFYKSDITDSKLPDIFREEKPDYLIHLAAQIDVVRSIESPIYDAETNIVGTINILECCRKFGVKKVVYSSSAAVYGIPKYLGIDEKHEISPISFYGLSKYTSEKYIKIFNKLYGLNYSILRYSNVYGPRQNLSGEGSVIYNFINKLFLNEQPYVFGDGLQTRDFIYVKDIARSTISCLENGNEKILNIGSGQPTSINELYCNIRELMDTSITPIYKDKRKGDLKESYFDISLAKEVLNWDLECTLLDGLKNTICFYENNKAF